MAKKKPELGHIAEDLRPLARPVAELVADPANARRHPERNRAAIVASLRLYGQRKPVVVRRAGMVVVAGNGTLEAARALGWTHLACVVVDDDATTATGFAIADNRSAELAEWDDGALARILGGLVEDNVSIADLGFDDDEMADLLAVISATDFSPDTPDNQGALDQIEPKLCPHCGEDTNVPPS